MRPAMLAALFLAIAALTQIAVPTPSAERAPGVVTDSVTSAQIAATVAPMERDAPVAPDTAAADTAEAELPPAEAEVAEAPPEADVPPAPLRYVAASTGLIVTLPPDWSATPTVSEAELPSYARYSFAAASGSPLAGATLHVERLAGLNALDRERWTRGLTPYGYHGLRPVGPVEVPVPGLGIELAEPGSGGAVAFVQRGQTFWAVHVQAPETVWAAHRAEAVALLGAVRLP